MKPKLYVAFLFLTAVHHFANTQSFFEKGWIVTTAGDTLKGFIADDAHSDLENRIYFKQDQKANPQEFTPQNVRSFFIQPNQYFEAHALQISMMYNRDDINRKFFLYRTHAGYISTFRLPSLKMSFIKTSTDSTVQPLFLIVISNNFKTQRQTDTIFDWRTDAYKGKDTVRYIHQYLQTLSNAFEGKKTLSVRSFPLNDDRVIYEVKTFNRAFHADYTPTVATKSQKKMIWSIGLNYAFPIYFGGKETNGDYSVQEQGAQLAVGFYGRNAAKGFNMELVASSIGHKKIYSPWLRLSYVTSIANKLSPYFGVQSNISLISPMIGLQFAPTKQNVFRAELGFVVGAVKYSTSFKIGYQQRLWQ